MTVHPLSLLLAPPQGDLRVNALPPADPAGTGDAANAAPLHGSGAFLSLVVPTYNERRNLPSVIAYLTNLLSDHWAGRYELIVVDDDSPDLTWSMARDLMPIYPMLRVMRRRGERGLASAIIRGWQAARGNVLGVIDADLQHPPEILLSLLDAIAQGADLAVASRHIEGGGVSEWSLMRRFLSRGAQVLGLVILPDVVSRVSDPMSGFFVVRREAIAGQTMNPLGYKILIEVLGRGTVGQITEVGYVFQERQEGESKVTWTHYWDYIRHLWRLRMSRGWIGHVRQRISVPIGRFLRFGLVGLSGVFVDMTVFYLLSDPTTLALGLTRSKIMAAEVAILNNFLWNDRWTFGDISAHQTSHSQRLKRFLKFNAVCVAGLVLNVLILNLLFNVFGINRYWANLIAIALVTLWNFWLNLKLSWRVTQVE